MTAPSPPLWKKGSGWMPPGCTELAATKFAITAPPRHSVDGH
jgi:hypothetical protein